MSDRDATGRIRCTTFRLGADTLAEMDYLCESWASETGQPETRAGLVRRLVRRAHAEARAREKKIREKS